MSRPYASETVFRAVADGTRREVIERLSKGDQSAIDLAQALRVKPPTLSHHLAVLRSSGLISQKREGRHRVFHLRPAGLRLVAEWSQRYRR